MRRSSLIATGVLLGFALGPVCLQWIHLQGVQWTLDRRLAQLTAQRAQLIQEQQRLQSDPAYVEGLIRSTFKVSQPGEYVVPLDAAPTRDKTR